MKIAVVILNWNGKKFLEQFLPSVVKYSTRDDTGIYVADNGSTDDSLNFLEANFPQINRIKLEKNYGFSEGYNRALSAIKAEYFVLLNSDVEVSDNWIDPIVQQFERDEKIAACQPKILSFRDKSKFEYAGAAGGFIDKFGYPFCRGRILSKIEADEKQYDTKHEIFWATGACMFVRAKLYFELGGLDKDFFAHMEEIDLCWRLKNAGYKIMCVPEVKVYHVGGGTLPNDNPAKLFLNYRNNLFLLYKNLPPNKLIPTLIVRLLLDFVSGNLYILQFKFSFYLAVVKAHFAFFGQLKKYKPKRKTNKGRMIKTEHLQIYKRSIVFDFFVKKIAKFSELQFSKK